jgi:hypothetical protein
MIERIMGSRQSAVARKGRSRRPRIAVIQQLSFRLVVVGTDNSRRVVVKGCLNSAADIFIAVYTTLKTRYTVPSSVERSAFRRDFVWIAEVL